MQTKICTKCGIEKILTDFHFHKAGKFQRISWCKDCQRQQRKEYHLLHKKESKEYSKIYNLKNKEVLKIRRLKYRYGITIEDYNNKLIEQNGVCAICEKKETKFDPRANDFRRLSVDHNHKNGKIRGLLCTNCNTALGRFNDDIKMLYNTINYLKKYQD